MRLDLLTNATVVDDAIRFVSQKSKENKQPNNTNDEDDKESENLIMMKMRTGQKKSGRHTQEQ